MMLCNALAEMSGSPSDRLQGGMFSALSRAVSVAERFDLSIEAIAACAQVAQSKPSSLLSAARYSRLPFKTCWFEWPGRIPGTHLIGEDWTEPAQAPIRMGVLVETLENNPQKFGATFLWEHDRATVELAPDVEHAINVCPLGLIIDWAGDGQSDRRLRLGTGYKSYADDPKELEAIREMDGKITPTITPYITDVWQRVIEPRGQALIDQVIRTSIQDLEGEIQKLVAVLCLINSRNCVSIQPSDLKKLNVQRQRRGKLPLLSYSTVSLNLSRSDARSAAKDKTDAGKLRRHIVRGHFKIRKGGIYWWRPFLRGSLQDGVVARRQYAVNDRPLDGKKS